MAANVTHPTWIEIDAVRNGEGDPAHAAHVETCPSCQSTLGDLAGLTADLTKAAHPPFDIPAEVDVRILWNARKQAQRVRKTTPTRRRQSGSRWAIAAAVVLAVGAAGIWQRVNTAPMEVARVATGDIDGNGTIDIRDAFLLAKAIENQSDAELAAVIDGETFDSGDVDRIAHQAVALGRRG